MIYGYLKKTEGGSALSRIRSKKVAKVGAGCTDFFFFFFEPRFAIKEN